MLVGLSLSRLYPQIKGTGVGKTPTPIYLRTLRFIAFFLFFTYIFLFFCHIKVWDIDFWWHLKTGEYIVENQRLPEKDPFAYTSRIDDPYNPAPEREGFLLKQYWLGQIIFYYAHKHFGFAGIKVLRGVLLTLTIMALFWGLKRKKVSTAVAYFFSGLLFLVATHYIGERPQLFSFLFTVLTIFLLEEFRNGKTKAIYPLPVLMMVWANIHGGFLVGDSVIVVYLVAESVKYRLGKSYLPLPWERLRTLLIVGVASCLFSLINPNTYKAIPAILTVEKYFKGVQELLPAFYFYLNKVRPLNYSYLILLFITLIGIISLRKRDLTASLLSLSTMLFSLKSSRYIIFFACIVMFFVAVPLDDIAKKIWGLVLKRLERVCFFIKKIALLEWTVCFLSLFLISSVLFTVNPFAHRIDVNNLPVHAARFIKQEHLPGNMFNGYAFGGYLLWALYPEKKVFIDSRGLKIGVTQDYDLILRAVEKIEGEDFGLKEGETLWEKTLDIYGVNFMVNPLLDYTGVLLPINNALLENPRWVLIYADHIAAIFIRNTEENSSIIKKHIKSADVFYNSLIYHASYNALVNKVNPRTLVSLGHIFTKTGRLKDARKAFNFALLRDPENQEALEGLKRLNSEF